MYFNTGQRYNKGDDIYAKNGFLKWESTNKGWYTPTVEGFEQSNSSTSSKKFWTWAAFVSVIAIVCLILWYRYKK